MSCSVSNELIDWTILSTHLDELYQYLYANNEVSGKLILDTDKNISSKIIKTNSGTKDSVSAPDAILSWHSHPVSCYKNEGTIYGWPSGEDLRESIISGMAGSACHLVPSVEGIYVIQVNPCFISKLISLRKESVSKKYSNLDFNLVRGLIISLTETYFKFTHLYRTTDFIKKNMKSDKITAKSFIDLVNNFKFLDLFKNNASCKVSKLIHKDCKGNFIKSFKNDEDSSVYSINSHGKVGGSGDGKNIDEICDFIKTIKFNECNFNKTEWHHDRVFKMTLYDNKVKIGNSYEIYDSLSYDEQYAFIEKKHVKDKGDIKIANENKGIKFKLFNMKGTCDHVHLSEVLKKSSYGLTNSYGKVKSRKSKSRKSKSKSKSRRRRRFSSDKEGNKEGNNILIIGSTQCSHCPIADKYAKIFKKILKFNYEFREYPTIPSAIEKARDINPKINSIPAFFHNGKYCE